MTTTVSQLDRFIPLPKAARRLKLSESSLLALIKSGKVRAALLPDGEIGVSEQSARQISVLDKVNEQLRTIRREDFGRMAGWAVTITEASEKYHIPGTTLRNWIDSGFVTVLEFGYGMKLDEADVAYCVQVHRIRKTAGILRVPLLNTDGTPYLLKHPELGEYRRKRNAAVIT